jgi:hypothetical protein
MRTQLLGAALALTGVVALADPAKAQVAFSFGSSPYYGSGFSIGVGNAGYYSPGGFVYPGVVTTGYAAPVYGYSSYGYGPYYGGYRSFYGSPYRGGTYYTTPGWGYYGGRRFYRYR